MPFVSNYILPAAKRIGKEFAKNMLPEVVDNATGKTNAKKAVKRAATTTVKKQLGGGPKRSRVKSKPRAESSSSKRKTKTSRLQTKRKPARTKIDFFKNLQRPLTTPVLIFLLSQKCLCPLTMLTKKKLHPLLPTMQQLLNLY